MTRALIFCLLLLLLTLLSAIVAPRLVPDSFWETRFERQLAAQTGLNVDVGAEVHFQLLPQPALGVENLKLTQPSVISVDVAPTLEAQNATAFLRFWPSLWGDIRVQNLMLNQPTLRITRDGTGEQSAKIGPIALTELLGAGQEQGINVSDDARPIVSTIERIDIADGRLRIETSQELSEVVLEIPSARIERDQQGSDIKWSTRIHHGEWRAVGSGHVDIAFTDDEGQQRPFRSQWNVSNLRGDLKADRLAIDGNLTDQVLSSLTLSEDDGWTASVHGFDSTLVNAVSVALGAPLSVQYDLSKLAIGAGRIQAGNLSAQIDLSGESIAEVRGDAALLFGTKGHSLTLNLAAETDMSDGALRSIILDRREAIAGIVRETPGLQQIAFNLESEHSNATLLDRQIQWALSGRLTDKGADVDHARLTVPRSHTVAFERGVIPLNGDEHWQGSLLVEAAGYDWLTQFLPEAVILGDGAETLRFDGEFWPRGDVWTSADWFRGLLEADGKRNFDLERQTLGAAKHLTITSAAMDLEWLPDSEQFVWQGAEPYAGAYVTALVKRADATDQLAQALDASRLTLRVERGLDRGQTFRNLLINVVTNAPVEIETDITKGTLSFATKDNKRVLTSLRGSISSWRDHLSPPDTWLSDTRVAIDGTAPVFVAFDSGKSWLFEQGDRKLTIPIEQSQPEQQGNVLWQRDDVSLQTLLAPLGPVARLFIREPLAGEGTAIPGAVPVGEAKFAPLSSDMTSPIVLVWDGNIATLTVTNFPAIALLPGLQSAEVTFEINNGVLRSWQAVGDGWTAGGDVGTDGSQIDLTIDRVSLDDILTTLVSPEFQRGIARQPDVSVNLRVKRLMDGEGALLATDVDVEGQFIEAAFQLREMRATLANGLLVSSVRPQLVCTRSPCRFEWVLGSWGQGLDLGPFELLVAPKNVRVEQELFAFTTVDWDTQEMIFHLDQHPIEFSPLDAPSDDAWQSLFDTALGQIFQALLAEQVADRQFLATGSIKKQANGWSTRNLLLTPSDPQASPLTLLLDGELDISQPQPGVDGQLLFDIDGQKAILTLSGPVDQLDLGLLGAYFRE